MEQIVPHLQHYPWGSVDAMPALLGRPPDGQPWAELWVGDHPRLPSTVVATGEPLDAGLPFLLKILAAAEPLSIQAHPSLEQAREGFERENLDGVPLDAPNRTYRDPNHKPELICALTRFEALCGFREPAAIIDDFGPVPALAELVAIMAAADSPTSSLRSAVEWLLTLDPENAVPLVAEVATHFELARRLDVLYPGHPGAVVALLLNHLELEPGQAVFLGAGNLHAYLEGVGVELMANSDNVIRGGLTPKHIDVGELLRVVDFSPLEPAVQTAVGAVHRFDSPVPDFSLVRLDLTGGDAGGSESFTVVGPELVLVTAGSITVEVAETAASLGPGEVVFLSPDDGVVTVGGAGVAWRATVGQ